jgi:hypothetical protein
MDKPNGRFRRMLSTNAKNELTDFFLFCAATRYSETHRLIESLRRPPVVKSTDRVSPKFFSDDRTGGSRKICSDTQKTFSTASA